MNWEVKLIGTTLTATVTRTTVDRIVRDCGSSFYVHGSHGYLELTPREHISEYIIRLTNDALADPDCWNRLIDLSRPSN